MKRFFKIYLILIALMSGSYANDKLYQFMGINSSIDMIDGKTNLSFGAKYGQQNGLWRTSLNLNASADYQAFIVQSDKAIFKEAFKTYQLKPYMGFAFGYMGSSLKGVESGLLYGGNLGVNYVFNDRYDIDFGYRYLVTNGENSAGLNNLILSLHYFY
jgi:hypothetical protein